MEKKQYRLKGHESFYLREGWLTKGLLAVSRDACVFQKNSGADALGVGTNMSKSIRYWLKAADLIVESPKEGTKLSQIGQILFENDLYFEDIFSCWLVHLNIAKNYSQATSWFIFYNYIDVDSFKRDELFNMMTRKLIDITGDINFAERSLKDDCSAILSMYSMEDTSNDPEDKKISPFTSLNLLNKTGVIYDRLHPKANSIDPLLVLYLICDELSSKGNLPIDTVVNGINMPGKLLQLNRLSTNELLDSLADKGFITINRTAGLDVIYPLALLNKDEIIRKHYKG